MTGYSTRLRDKRRREEMIDEAVRRVRPRWPGLWAWVGVCLRNGKSPGQFGPSWSSFAHDVRAEFRRMAAR